MSEEAILTAARSTVAAALPGWRDWSDDPAAVKPDKLGAFLVVLSRDSAQPESMGSAREEVQLTIRAELFFEFAPATPGRTVATMRGAAVREALRQSVTIRPLVDFILGSTLDVDLGAAERRIARASVSLSVLTTI